MSCQLDKVLKTINEVAGEVKNPQAIKQLNELKSALTAFAGAMESNTVKSYKNLITDIEGTTKVEDKNVTEAEVVAELKLKEELLLLLDAYTGSKKTRAGGGYTENVKQKNGYLEANMDEDVAKGTIEKGIKVSNIREMLPTVNGNIINSYRKAYDKYYNERNRSKAVVSKMTELTNLLEAVKNEPTVAEALGVKANVIEEATPLIPIDKVNPQIAKELQGCSK